MGKNGQILLLSMFMSLFLIPCAEGQQKSPEVGDDKATSYEIRFDANGGSKTPSPIRYTMEEKVTLPILDDKTKEGCHFLGWKVKEGSGNWYEGSAFGIESLTVGKGRIGSPKLIAIWHEPAEFKVSVSGLSPKDSVAFSLEALNGVIVGWKYDFTVNGLQPTKVFKCAPTGDFKITAVSWNSAGDVRSEADANSFSEVHSSADGYEFKFLVKNASGDK